MPEPLPKPSLLQRLKRGALALDSWLDHAVYVSIQAVRSLFEALYAFSNRFHVSGWRRVGVELACDGLTFGVVGAILALALAVPAFRETTPDWLQRSDIAVTFLDRYGQPLGQRGIRHNDTVPLAEMPDYVVKAVLATEDRRFYEHFGIDVMGTLRAVAANARADGVVQGGSSITQQLAKNLFLSNERTIERKIKEAYLALWIETHLTKDEILKLYLDRAYMGGGAFGIESASQYYFGKSVRDVSLAEAAMLAGLFKAPSKYAPTNNLAAARARANTVLSNMVEAGFLSEGQVYGAKRNPATPVDRATSQAPDYYLDWAYDQVTAMVDDGKLGHDTTLTVKTGLDPAVQKVADNTIEAMLREHGQTYNAHQAAMVVMETDGTVRALVGGRDYSQSQFNRASDAARQPGSSFKPFVYTTALLNGFTPDSVVVDSPLCIKNWCPQNYGRSFSGPVTLMNALTRSINIVPIKLSLAMGKNAVDGRRMIIDTAHRMGIQTELKESWALPIGVEAVNLVEMVGGYGVFASGGYKAPPHAAVEIRNPTGEVLWRFDPGGENPLVINPATIAEMNKMLNSVVENGTGKRAQLPGIKVAGKTGTTNSYRDAWFMGFTGNLVGGVWYGNDDYHPTNKMTGGTLPAMTWQQVMSFAHQGIELKPMPGVAPFPNAPGSAVEEAKLGDRLASDAVQRPGAMSRKTATTLTDIERLFDQASPPSDTTSSIGVDSASVGSGSGVSYSGGKWIFR
ncbi:MAG: PBP1A family penicillin-binding protein [Aestuariivirgaceae bacterium]